MEQGKDKGTTKYLGKESTEGSDKTIGKGSTGQSTDLEHSNVWSERFGRRSTEFKPLNRNKAVKSGAISFIAERAEAMIEMDLDLRGISSSTKGGSCQQRESPYCIQYELQNRIFGDMFVNEKEWVSNNGREKIVIADIPYNLDCMGKGQWNRPQKNFLNKFTTLLQEKLQREQRAQSWIFCSYEQAVRLQRKVGGKIMFNIEEREADRDRLHRQKLCKNQVQVAVYTLWGDLKKSKSYAFDHNVITYAFGDNEKLRNENGHL
eukprot:Nk52_evm1s574 gene=Nk52_evmTU1s574